MTSYRETLQAAGTHPAPCARHCEATAFNIEIRRLTAENMRLREENKTLRAEVARLRLFEPGRRSEHKVTPAPHVGPTNEEYWRISQEADHA